MISAKNIVLLLIAGSLFIPSRITSAGGAVQSAGEGISGAISALGSTRIEPVFNPTIGLQGNIGSRIVSRAFGEDDPSGDPIVVTPTGTTDPIDDPLEYEKTVPSWRSLLTAEDEFYNG